LPAGKADAAVTDRKNILQDAFAQRIGVGIDLEQARPAHGSQQVQRMEKANAAAQKPMIDCFLASITSPFGIPP